MYRRWAEEQARVMREREEIERRNVVVALRCAFPLLPEHLIDQEAAARGWNYQVLLPLSRNVGVTDSEGDLSVVGYLMTRTWQAACQVLMAADQERQRREREQFMEQERRRVEEMQRIEMEQRRQMEASLRSQSTPSPSFFVLSIHLV